ncbi:hypothetical protein BW731_12375 [Vagococcus martis]|uniref:Uncharacterized protein n=1 Tax=Vagococcus martis TaxID=1768210 RepID=A0A1V4DDS0_9ENTE|nr:hypothetical protein BW731_12375 [Vagococcus martis]
MCDFLKWLFFILGTLITLINIPKFVSIIFRFFNPQNNFGELIGELVGSIAIPCVFFVLFFILQNNQK